MKERESVCVTPLDLLLNILYAYKIMPTLFTHYYKLVHISFWCIGMYMKKFISGIYIPFNGNLCSIPISTDRNV